MKTGTWILLGVLVVLAIAVFVVLQRPGELSTSGSSGDMLVQYDSAAVDKIEVHASGGTVVLEKQGSVWWITAPLRAKADNGAVTSAISKGNAIQLKGVISSNPAKQQVFQVDSGGTLVKFFVKGSEQSAIRIGKPGPSYTESYVRKEGTNEVFLAEGMLGAVFARQARDWRDKTIFKSTQETVASVRFQYGDTTFTLARKDSLWRIDGEPASDMAVRGFLGSITGLLADDFVDSTLTVVPPLTAVIDVDGVQIRFTRNPGQPNYYVLTSQSPQVFIAQEWKAAQVLKRRKDFVSGS